MTIKLGLTTENINTQYAPLAALFAHYQQNQVLKPLEQVMIPMKSVEFKSIDKLVQVFVSVLAGCQTLSQVNQRLKTRTTAGTNRRLAGALLTNRGCQERWMR